MVVYGVGDKVYVTAYKKQRYFMFFQETLCKKPELLRAGEYSL